MLLAFSLIGGVGVAVWFRSNDGKLRRALRASPRRAIGALPEGAQGRVVGRVVAASEILEAPLSGRRCVYYRLEVLESDGDSHKRVALETASVPFFLEDGTGRALVDPTHARFSLFSGADTSSGLFDDPTDRERAILQRTGVASQGAYFNKALRYLETVIKLGETVAIAGLAVREIDPQAGAGAGYRDEPPTRTRLDGSPRYPLLISDKPDTWE